VRVVAAGVEAGAVRFGQRQAVAAGLGGGERGAGGGEPGVAVDDEGGRVLLGFGHVLGHGGAAPVARQLQLAAVFVQLALQQRKQARFAGAVAPHEADFFARVEHRAGTVEHHFGAAAQRDLAQGDHA